MNKTLDISWQTILRVSIALVSFYIVYLIKDVLIWIIFGLIISVLFNPAINFLERKRFPRVLATILVYLILLGILGGIIYSIAPIFIYEIGRFSKNFPQYFEEINPFLKGLKIEALQNIEGLVSLSSDALHKAAGSIFNALSLIFGGLTSTIFILSIAFFFSLEGKGVERVLPIFFPEKHRKYIKSLWKKIRNKVSAWFGTRILAAIFVGVASYITLSLFEMNYSLTLSLFAGVMDIIPILGPIFSIIIIVILAALDSWTKAIFILVIFILIQQIEGNILTPILSKKLIGLPPVFVLISLMIGATLFGLLGAILAIPLAAIIYEFLKDLLEKKEDNSIN